MNQVKIVYYKSAKAYYTVESDGRSSVATLEKYMGDNSHMPPRRVTYLKTAHKPAPGHRFSNSLLEDVSRATAKK